MLFDKWRYPPANQLLDDRCGTPPSMQIIEIYMSFSWGNWSVSPRLEPRSQATARRKTWCSPTIAPKAWILCQQECWLEKVKKYDKTFPDLKCVFHTKKQVQNTDRITHVNWGLTNQGTQRIDIDNAWRNKNSPAHPPTWLVCSSERYSLG